MCFSPSCICSSSSSGSLRVLPHYWTLSSLITQFHHLNLLLRELSSKTTMNACRELTDNLHIFGLKQSCVKTAANPIYINWFQSSFLQRLGTAVLNFMLFSLHWAQSRVVGQYQQKDKCLAKLKALGTLPLTSMGPRFHCKYLPCLRTRNDASFPGCSLPRGQISLFVCKQTQSSVTYTSFR